MSLLSLPVELLDMVIRGIKTQRDLNSLAQTNRTLHTLANPRLYLKNIDNNDASALTWAAQNDSVGTAKHVLRLAIHSKCKLGVIKRSLGDIRRKWEQKPLFFAAQNGSEKVMKLLLKRGAKPDCRGPMQTPLYIAVANQHVKIVKLLLRFKANPNPKNIHPRVLRANTPLHMAAELGDVAIVKELLASGAHVDVLNSRHRTPLDEASIAGAREAGKILLERAINKIRMCSSKLSSSMLHCAVINGDSKLVHTLLQNGVDPDSLDPDGVAPSDKAVRPDNSDILRILLKHGANPNRRPLLMRCLRYGCEENAAMLIEYGANPNERDSCHNTPLHGCADNLFGSKFLAEHGAQLDARNMFGETPLFRAVSVQNYDAVRYLLQCGSDPCVSTYSGETPLEHARKMGHSDMVICLWWMQFRKSGNTQAMGTRGIQWGHFP